MKFQLERQNGQTIDLGKWVAIIIVIISAAISYGVLYNTVSTTKQIVDKNDTAINVHENRIIVLEQKWASIQDSLNRIENKIR